MKRIKYLIAFVVAVACINCMAISVYAGVFSKNPDNIDKGRAFMEQKMFPQAIRAFETAINTDPTNPKIGEAHFQLAILYLHQGNTALAKERFETAILLKTASKETVGDKYMSAGLIYLKKGIVSKALDNFKEAISYHPPTKKNLGKVSYEKGIFYLAPERMCSDTAKQLFTFASTCDLEYGKKAAAALNAYANDMLKVAKDLPKEKRGPFLKEARKILAQTEIDTVIPPPSWKSRPGYPKTFVGNGYEAADAVTVAVNGIDMYYGDKVIVRGLELSRGTVSLEKISESVFVMQTSEHGHNVKYRSAPGKSFTVDIQYFD